MRRWVAYLRLERDEEYRPRLLAAGHWTGENRFHVQMARDRHLDYLGDNLDPPCQRRIIEVVEPAK